MKWSKNIIQLHETLKALSIQDLKGLDLGQDEAFGIWSHMTLRMHHSGRRVFFIGNGASASMSSHFAADLSKSVGLPTEVFTDLAQITALANDLSFDQVFSEPLRLRMAPGDMLVVISSSGNSPNVVQGIKTARGKEGTIITLSAMDPKNQVRGLGDLNFYVSAQTYGLAETSHAAILHFWLDQMVRELGKDE
jgi:D-sedoheptulose 7-phosphate isomerase